MECLFVAVRVFSLECYVVDLYVYHFTVGGYDAHTSITKRINMYQSPHFWLVHIIILHEVNETGTMGIFLVLKFFL